MADTQTHSVPVKTAVSNAMQFIRELYTDEQIKDVLLEEVEFSEPADQWLITIGFMRNKIKDKSSSSIADLILPERETIRKYKIVHIDAQSGKPISMKIREI
jgi:hypothetical protein